MLRRNFIGSMLQAIALAGTWITTALTRPVVQPARLSDVTGPTGPVGLPGAEGLPGPKKPERLMLIVMGGVAPEQDDATIFKAAIPVPGLSHGPGAAHFNKRDWGADAPHQPSPHRGFNIDHDIHIGTIDELTALYRHRLQLIADGLPWPGSTEEENQTYLRECREDLGVQACNVTIVPFGWAKRKRLPSEA